MICSRAFLKILVRIMKLHFFLLDLDKLFCISCSCLKKIDFHPCFSLYSFETASNKCIDSPISHYNWRVFHFPQTNSNNIQRFCYLNSVASITGLKLGYYRRKYIKDTFSWNRKNKLSSLRPSWNYRISHSRRTSTRLSWRILICVLKHGTERKKFSFSSQKLK